jgi:hypothetical protein
MAKLLLLTQVTDALSFSLRKKKNSQTGWPDIINVRGPSFTPKCVISILA